MKRFLMRHVRSVLQNVCTYTSLPKPYGMMKTSCGYTVEPPMFEHGRIINHHRLMKDKCYYCRKPILIPKTEWWWEYHKSEQLPEEVKK